MGKIITLPPLTEKAWSELEQIRKDCGFEPEFISYEEYLRDYEKKPLKAVMF